jgi:ATP-dependent helicase HrpA
MLSSELPIAAYRDQICESVVDNECTLIVADTGAGKSTQVVKFLLEAGMSMVMTQPRRIAAISLAKRIAKETDTELGDLIGYHVSDSDNYSENTRCLIVTDGLAMVKELTAIGNYDVLIVDEVHEWNIPIEVLIALARIKIAEDPNFRIVIMSATINAPELAEFMGANVIEVPGRCYPITERTPSSEILDDVLKLFYEGRNILVFQPGKPQIEEMFEQLTDLELNAEIITLHGQQSYEVQQLALNHYDRVKIVLATNVAETSLTIDDIDAVIDTGIERRIEIVNGVEGTYLLPISQSNSLQRRGRAGRTKPGIYIDHCVVPVHLREKFPKPEINRKLLDKTVLQLAETGLQMDKITFFHQPDVQLISDAVESLIAIGCMRADGTVTAIGRAASSMPIRVKSARMIIEAAKRKVVDDVITIAALMEIGAINMRPKKGEWNQPWKWLVADEDTSDALAQLSLYKQAELMSKDEMIDNAIFIKAFYQVKNLRKELIKRLEKIIVDMGSSENRTDIIRSICSGMVDHVWQSKFGALFGKNGETRKLQKDSCIRQAGLVVGLPSNLEIQTQRGKVVLNIVVMPTKVTLEDLEEIAPELITKSTGNRAYYDPFKGIVTSVTIVSFNGVVINEITVDDPHHKDAEELRAQAMQLRQSYSGRGALPFDRETFRTTSFSRSNQTYELTGNKRPTTLGDLLREQTKEPLKNPNQDPASQERLKELMDKYK